MYKGTPEIFLCFPSSILISWQHYNCLGAQLHLSTLMHRMSFMGKLDREFPVFLKLGFVLLNEYYVHFIS